MTSRAPHRSIPGATLAALVALSAACRADAPTPSTAAGVALELATVRGATLSDLAYDVALRVPADRERPIEGTSDVRFRWDDPDGRPVVLDFLSPGERVQEVRVNGEPVAWRAENDHVVVPPDGLEPGAENVVSLAYAAGDESLNRSHDFLYTLFVPERARFSLPVFDQPDLKARWRLTLEVPEGWVAVANGAAVEEPAEAGAGGLYRFAETEPLPTYLFAFVAGRFQVEEAQRGGRRMRMYHRETDSAKVARNLDDVFDLHETALDWLEGYTDIDYPFQKFDFVLIPSFQYGGMEHPGQILYNQDGILLDESATQGAYLGRASVIAHETAHMWFGDLVTMAWFDDVWTKEVFANFMAAKIVHPSFPDVDHDLRFLLAHHPSAYGVDRTAGANPIRQPLENLREAGTLYGAIIYQKAPVVMRQLEALVGEATFRDGLREYLREHAYGNATWPDLVGILDRLSAEDVTAWSHVWVEEAGRPTVRVARVAGEEPALRIEQEDPAGEGRVWPQPLALRLHYPDTTVITRVQLGGEPVTVPLPGGRAPDFVLPNGSGVEYGRFVLDDASRAWLMERLPGVDAPLARGAAWVTLWDAVLEGDVTPEAFLDLALAALPREGDEQNTQRVLGYLEGAYWRLLDAGDRRRLAPRVEGALWRGVRTGETSTVRSAYFGTWRDVVLTGEGVERLRAIWAREEQPPGVTLSENDYTALATGLALREVDGWEAILDEQEARVENPDRRARFAFVRPALSADPAVREAWFEALRDPARREREPWVLAGLSALNHPLRAEHARRFVGPALEMVEEVQATGDIFFPGRWLDAVLGGHASPEVADQVEAFLADHPDYPPRLRGKILQSGDMVERSARVVHGWTPAGRTAAP